MVRGYSIYKIDKENLIDSVSKPILYYQKKITKITKTVVSNKDLDQEENLNLKNL